MIEAVNSVVVNASLLRNNAEQSQQDRLNSLAVSTTEGEGVELQLAPYVSPFIEIDTNFKKAVLQIRDSSTGEVQRQFPSETTMRARAAQAEIESQSIGERAPRIAVESNDTPDAPDLSVSAQMSAPRVAESQTAAAAFVAGSLSGGQQAAASVSVFA